MTLHTETTIETINYIFTGIFVFEAAVKLIAFGSQYFYDSWNVFDFFIASISVLFIAIKQLFHVDIGKTTTVLRTLKLGRILKLFRALKQLQIIF